LKTVKDSGAIKKVAAFVGQLKADSTDSVQVLFMSLSFKKEKQQVLVCLTRFFFPTFQAFMCSLQWKSLGSSWGWKHFCLECTGNFVSQSQMDKQTNFFL
jgi:hypothetical protein